MQPLRARKAVFSEKDVIQLDKVPKCNDVNLTEAVLNINLPPGIITGADVINRHSHATLSHNTTQCADSSCCYHSNICSHSPGKSFLGWLPTHAWTTCHHLLCSIHLLSLSGVPGVYRPQAFWMHPWKLSLRTAQPPTTMQAAEASIWRLRCQHTSTTQSWYVLWYNCCDCAPKHCLSA